MLLSAIKKNREVVRETSGKETWEELSYLSKLRVNVRAQGRMDVYFLQVWIVLLRVSDC